MANEITANIRIQLANADLKNEFNPGRIQINQTGQGMFNSVRSIATTETSVSLTGITTPGLAIIYNLDQTNYCELGFETTKTPIKLRGNAVPNVIDLNSSTTTLYLKANTAATKVHIIVFEA